MNSYFRHFWLVGLIAVFLPTFAPAEEASDDFVRAQAAKAAFVTEVAKVNRYASDMFRIDTYAVMRMTHQHWDFDIDHVIKNGGQTYAWKVNSNAEDANYDVRRFAASLSRNQTIAEDLKDRAQELVDLVDQLIQLSLELAKLYDTGDARLAGDHYYENIVPVYEAIRRGEATITSELAREIRLDAAMFKP